MKSSSRDARDMESGFNEVGIIGGHNTASSSVEEKGSWPTRDGVDIGLNTTLDLFPIFVPGPIKLDMAYLVL